MTPMTGPMPPFVVTVTVMVPPGATVDADASSFTDEFSSIFLACSRSCLRCAGSNTLNPPAPSLSRVGFLRVVIMPILLPSCMSLSLWLPAASRGLGQRQHRQERCLLLWHRDSRPGFGDKAAQGQRCLVEQRHQDQDPASAKDTHQPEAGGTPRPRLLRDESRD